MLCNLGMSTLLLAELSQGGQAIIDVNAGSFLRTPSAAYTGLTQRPNAAKKVRSSSSSEGVGLEQLPFEMKSSDTRLELFAKVQGPCWEQWVSRGGIEMPSS